MAEYFTTFEGPAGSALSSVAGWAGTGYGTGERWVLDGEGALGWTNAISNNRWVARNIGSARHFVEVTLGSTFISQPTIFNVAVGATASSAPLAADLRNNGSIQCTLSGGVAATLPGPWVAGDVLRIELDAPQGTINGYKNGTLVATKTYGAPIANVGSYVGVNQAYNTPAAAYSDIFRDFRADILPELDSAAPVLSGAITLNSRSTSTISTSCPAATDNVGVVAYHVRINAGPWVDNLLEQTYTHTGLSPDTSYTVEWSALDAIGNRSAALALETATLAPGATANSILLTTGPQDGNPKGLLYDLAGTVAAGDWLSYEVISGPTPSGGTFYASPMGAFSYAGPSPAVLVIQPYVNGVATAEPITVNLYDQVGGGDTESPVLSGAITVNSKTSTSINVSCPAATDNVGVAYYEWSSNAGTSWVTGTTAHNFTGLAAGTQYQIRARASDAAGNKSGVLSLAVATDAEAAPVLTGTITVSNKTSTSITASCPSASGSVTGYEWSIGGAWVSDTTSHSFTGLVASTEYTVQVRAVGPGGNSATLSLPVTTDAVAAAASLTLGPLVNNTGTLHASVNGITVHVINGAAVVTKTGVSTNSAGVLTVSDAAFTAGTTYRAIIVFADDSEGLGKVVAT